MLEFFLCVGLIYALLKIDSLTEDINFLIIVIVKIKI